MQSFISILLFTLSLFQIGTATPTTFSLQAIHNTSFTISPEALLEHTRLRFDSSVQVTVDLSLSLHKRSQRRVSHQRGFTLRIGIGPLSIGIGAGKNGGSPLSVSIGPASHATTSTSHATTSTSTPIQTGSAWNGQTTLAATDIDDNNAWTVQIGFGTPVQTLPMLLDTGSSDIVVFGTACSGCTQDGFDTSASSTLVKSGQTFSETFAGGTAFSGIIVNDTVTLGSFSTPNHTIGVIEAASNFASGAGIIGVGLNHGSVIPTSGQPTTFSSLVSQGSLAQPVLGIRLVDTNKYTNAGGGGEYTFGGIEQQYVSGTIEYTNVVSSNFWGVPLDGIYMNGQSAMAPSDFPGVLIDTGTTLICVSNTTATNINSKIPNSIYNASTQYWSVPCNSITLLATTPALYFQIGGIRYGVPADDLAFRGSITADGMCLSGVQGCSPSFTVLGDIFLQNHYVVLEYENGNLAQPRIGLANRTDVLPILSL